MKPASATILSKRPTLGVVIRFQNSAATLPGVLEALRRQTVQPDRIIGVNKQSTDTSPALLRAAGAELIEWPHAYNHPRVLNFALRHCPTDLVLVLSSHTVLQSPEALQQLVAAMANPRTACASGKWDHDAFYSDAIDWPELQAKGLKFGSIYSNSMGIIRRSLWEQIPFDESQPTMEDSAWALEQVKRGATCRRLDFAFDYQRSGRTRDFIFAVITFRLAARHGLRVTWLSVTATLRELFGTLIRWAASASATTPPRCDPPLATPRRMVLLAFRGFAKRVKCPQAINLSPPPCEG